MTETGRFLFYLQDTVTMTKRCLLLSIRNLDAFLTGVGTPVLMMLLFVFVLGGSIHVENMNYIDYLVPGIMLQCIGQCGSTTAVSVNRDFGNGIMERFRSMPVSPASLLSGHAWAAIIRNIITAALIFMTAFLIGFRPAAGIIQWMLAVGILLLFMAAVTWLSILFGIISGSAEGANTITAVIMFLPYLSSGFAPTEKMPAALRIFAEHQPMTPIIESIRSLLVKGSSDENLLPAVLWCTALLIFVYAAAAIAYKKKMSK